MPVGQVAVLFVPSQYVTFTRLLAGSKPIRAFV